ncbi:PH domain-containing protein [Alteromonas pelagimontana]|uniref:PH domain-containing protein n=1 Tax=Alteromonas pelagimontana TaxID=1858656 RepID=A0A6M4MAN4_9ALTE|nr:PH domain-containing protein [Alteromonas pelagimontana]QJR80097.1 PH domain-containing protein [Alteromonas pelagimontana]
MTEDAFSNHVVDLEALPAIEEVAMQAISPRYRVVNLAVTVFLVTLLMAIASAVRFQPWVDIPEALREAYPVVAGLLLAYGVVSFGYHFMADKRIRFAVRQQDIVLQSGLFFCKTVCQPILRVQHVELKRGPIERMAGLSKLQVFSAGGAGHTFEIPGLPSATAQKIRQFILDHKDLDAK